MIYLDHNATTPILPEVLDAMMPFLTTEWGNPSSTYKFGARLKSVIETAREQVAELIGVHARDVIFTSCATESNNTALAAALQANPGKRHLITSQVEHSSVLNYCMALGTPCSGDFTSPSPDVLAPRSGGFTPPSGLSPFPYDHKSKTGDVKSPLHQTAPKPGDVKSPLHEGYHVTYLPVDRDGLLKLADLEAAITDQTAVVSLMWANNETGVLFPVAQIAEICRARGVLYHCDAVQAAGKVEIDVQKVPADYLSLTVLSSGEFTSPFPHSGHENMAA